MPVDFSILGRPDSGSAAVLNTFNMMNEEKRRQMQKYAIDAQTANEEKRMMLDAKRDERADKQKEIENADRVLGRQAEAQRDASLAQYRNDDLANRSADRQLNMQQQALENRYKEADLGLRQQTLLAQLSGQNDDRALRREDMALRREDQRMARAADAERLAMSQDSSDIRNRFMETQIKNMNKSKPTKGYATMMNMDGSMDDGE